MSDAIKAIEAELAELHAQRDAKYAQTAPLEARLTEVNAKIEALRVEQMDLANQIDETLGRGEWIALKKRIGALSEARMSLIRASKA